MIRVVLRGTERRRRRMIPIVCRFVSTIGNRGGRFSEQRTTRAKDIAKLEEVVQRELFIERTARAAAKGGAADHVASFLTAKHPYMSYFSRLFFRHANCRHAHYLKVGNSCPSFTVFLVTFLKKRDENKVNSAENNMKNIDMATKNMT